MYKVSYRGGHYGPFDETIPCRHDVLFLPKRADMLEVLHVVHRPGTQDVPIVVCQLWSPPARLPGL